ncbi:hypothetical protein D3C84_659620 [compost metagenome]
MVEQGDGGTLLLEGGACLFGTGLQAGQFGAPLIEAVTQLHQLLQAIAVGIPGFAQASQGCTLGQLLADLVEAFCTQALLFGKVEQLLLAFAAGLLGLLFKRQAVAQLL